MFNTNQVIVKTQEEFDEDINKQLRTVSIDPNLNLFIPGLIALKYVLDLDGRHTRGTACTDGYRVYADPDYWNMCSGPQKIGVMFHEMDHNMLLHFFRFAGADHELANIACDIVVHRFISALAKVSKFIELPPNPPGGQIIVTDAFGDRSEEIIYNLLARRQDEQQGQGPDGQPGPGGQGDQDGDPQDDSSGSSSGGGGKGDQGVPDGALDDILDGADDYAGPGEFTSPGTPPEDDEDEEEEEEGEGGGEGDKEGEDKENGEGQGKDDGKGKKPQQKSMKDMREELKALRDKWEETKQTIAQTARIQGNMPAGLIEMLEESKPQLDWTAILQQFILATSTVDINEEGFDRRFFGEGLYIESIDRPSVSDVIFAKDTSGSMYTDWLAQSATEIKYAMIVANIQRCWVLDIDAAMQGEIKEYGPMDDIDMSARGRGGTDFRPPFVWAEKECPTQPACLIYFTDGYGPFPEEEPPYPVLWMTFGLDPEDYPFGTVIDMRQLVA